MYSYQAYGLRIHSELRIPELLPALDHDAPADIHIRLCEDRYIDGAGQRESPCVDAGQSMARFAWKHIAAIEVCDGCRIDIWPHPDVDQELLRLPLLGVAFGALLHQRGMVVLHASSVLIDGEAVALVGNKGHGKSTTAAAMYRAGHRVLGDDVAAVELGGAEGPRLYPAYPHLHVWPHAARMLGTDPDHLPRLRAGGTKRSFAVRQRFEPHPVALRGIYLLEYGQELRLTSTSGRDAFARLVPHCYASRYFSGMDETPQFLLETCGELVRSVPVWRLTRRNAVQDALAAARRVISNELRGTTTSVHYAAA